MVPTSEPRRRGAQSKADTAYAHIKEQIERGAFEPYQRVLAAPIAAELGVSGVPVREAIQRLAAEGLLQIVHNVGARVAVIDDHAYRAGMEALAVLDGTATSLAAGQMGAADLERAEAINRSILSMLENFDPALFEELNTQFHEVLYSACPNERILELARSEWKKFSSIRGPGAAVDRDRARESVEEHGELLDLIRGSAPSAQIEQAARRHVLKSLEARTGHRSRLL